MIDVILDEKYFQTADIKTGGAGVRITEEPKYEWRQPDRESRAVAGEIQRLFEETHRPVYRASRTSIGNASDADDIGAFHFYKEKQSSLPAVLRHNS